LWQEKVGLPSVVPNVNKERRMVDWDEKTWNTFFDIILGWEPVLRQIGALENEENDTTLS